MLKILFSLKLTFLVKILVPFAKKWHQLLVSVFLWYASQPEMRVSLLQLQEITISRAARCKFFPLSFAAPYRKKGAHALGLRLGGKLSVADVVRRFLASRTVPFPQDF